MSLKQKSIRFAPIRSTPPMRWCESSQSNVIDADRQNYVMNAFIFVWGSGGTYLVLERSHLDAICFEGDD